MTEMEDRPHAQSNHKKIRASQLKSNMKVKTQQHAVQGPAIGRQAATNAAAASGATNQAPLFNFYK